MARVFPLAPLVLLGSLSCAAQDLPPEEEIMAGPLQIQLTSDEVSYFRVRVPKSVPQILIFSEATREPVIWAFATGYWPKESHFDVSNFPHWARSSLRSDVLVDLGLLRPPSRCDDPQGVLQQCLAGAQSGDLELACGDKPQPVPGYGRSSICSKQMGTCSQSACTAHLQGPTRCDANASLDEGQCMCQQGFCADASGHFCVSADSMQMGCEKVTGRVCHLYECDPAKGRARCEDGLCVCAPGHCSVNGICQPGPICRQSDEFRFCEMPVVSQGALKPDVVTEGTNRPTLPPVSRLGRQCCRLLNKARNRDAGQFARCVAAHFYSVESQKRHGVQANLLADMTNGGEAFDELVFMARSASPRSTFRNAARRGSAGAVKFWFTLVRNVSSSFLGVTPWPLVYAMPARLQELQLFRTLQELVNPLSSPTGHLALQLREVPISTGDTRRLGSSTSDLEEKLGPETTPSVTSAGASLASVAPNVPHSVRLELRRDELVLLRERSSDMNMHGDLQLHLLELPAGSTVLYSRTSPWLEPRSLLDFGHAKPAVVQNRLRRLEGGPKESVWSARQKSAWGRRARYFGILPGADGDVDAYFTGLEPISPLQEVGIPQSVKNLIGKPGPPVAAASTPAPPVAPVMEPPWIAAMWFGLTFAAVSYAVVRWILRRDSPEPEGTGTIDLNSVLDTPRRLARQVLARQSAGQQLYMPVSRSEHETVSCGEPDVAIAESDDDTAANDNVRETTTLCPKAPSLSSLRVFGEEVKKRLWAARQHTGRRSFLGSEDEDSDSSPRPGQRYSERGEEARGLLSHDEEEDEGSRASRGRAHSPDPLCRGSRKAMPPKSPIDMGSSEDLEAMQALLKLRPAARDSVGDDTLEDVDGPLMGTDRSEMLKR